MPTGYTDVVGKGELTDFSEFALRCSRAMGVSIMQRDESIDVPLRHHETMRDYEYESLAKAKDAYAEAGARSQEEWAEVQRREADKENAARAESKARRLETVANYRRMLAEVLAWQPPTSEHENFKKFMVDQLEESIKFDGPGEWDEPIQVLPVALLVAKEMDRLKACLENRARDVREAEERVASRNKWVDDFLASLPNPRVLEQKAGV